MKYTPSSRVVGFFRRHRGEAFASSALMEPMAKRFVEGLEQLALAEDIPLITFAKGARKDDVAAQMRTEFAASLLIVPPEPLSCTGTMPTFG